jgi:hypothetical protein
MSYFQNKEHSTNIHMGKGEESFGKVYLLQRRFDKAFEYLHRIQQIDCRCITKCECKSEHLFYKEQINIIVKDIAMALTGQEWKPT